MRQQRASWRNGLLHSSIVVIVQSIRFNARFNARKILARPIARASGNAVIAIIIAMLFARNRLLSTKLGCNKRNYVYAE